MKLSRRPAPSLGFVSTYPPTACGLATFTANLRGAMAHDRGSEEGLGVVSLVDGRLDQPGPEVLFQHVNGDHSSLERAVAILNEHDVALLQHEYGIYGGPDGVEVLDLIGHLEIPSIVTLHTVLDKPTLPQKKILERIVALADRTVVMSQTALRRLQERYEIDAARVTMVPHGARAGLGAPAPVAGPRPVVLTWGLIGPGKGLETSIQAFAMLKDLRPLPRYVILGKTHPKVQTVQGDSYLNGLKAMVNELGLEDLVEFDGRYLDTDSLVTAIRHADIALLPYESTEQVTSGVLVEALAAGKPVVATSFPHALEMLSTGAGALVPHFDADEMAIALRRILSEPAVAAEMATTATSIGATLHWPVVADEYESIASALIDRQVLVGRSSGQRREVALAKVG